VLPPDEYRQIRDKPITRGVRVDPGPLVVVGWPCWAQVGERLSGPFSWYGFAMRCWDGQRVGACVGHRSGRRSLGSRRKLPAATTRRPAGTAVRAVPRCVGRRHVVLSLLALRFRRDAEMLRALAERAPVLDAAQPTLSGPPRWLTLDGQPAIILTRVVSILPFSARGGGLAACASGYRVHARRSRVVGHGTLDPWGVWPEVVTLTLANTRTCRVATSTVPG